MFERVIRKLAKSTLILIPMFGVPYVVFLAMVDDKLSDAIQVAKLYFEMTFNSFNVSIPHINPHDVVGTIFMYLFLRSMMAGSIMVRVLTVVSGIRVIVCLSS
jgi:7 transmembrane receptor (Secretin family)